MFAEMDPVVRALLFGALFLIGLSAVLWTVYDAQTQGATSGWAVVAWIFGGTGIVLILPALVINAFNLEPDKQDLVNPLSYLGLVGTLFALLSPVAYFATRSQGAQQPTQPIYMEPLAPMPTFSRTEPLPIEEAPAQHTMVLRRPMSKLASLWITSGPRRGTSFMLNEVTNIGRSGQKNDIIIADDGISSEHARVRYDEEKKAFVLHDLASTNGSWLVTPDGKQKIEAPHALANGDVIEFGGTQLSYQEVAEAGKS